MRLADGKPQVLDGPYADSKEQLGGYYLIEAPDLDAALAWAARCPTAATAWSSSARSGRCASGVNRPVDRGARPGGAAREAADAVARRSYGKLVAWLAARSRDVAAAEDALADAFAAALADWPARGCPANPEAWLMTVARRRLVDRDRRRRTGEAAAATLALLAEGLADAAEPGLPDQRLGAPLRLRPSRARAPASGRR